MRNPSVLIGVFLTLGIVPAVNGQTWTNIAGGNWSDPVNWSGNTVPTSGPTTQLVFPTYPPNNGSYTATNDLGLNPFVLNGLTFNSADTNSATLIIANAAGSSLQFAGVNPFIMQNGVGGAAIADGLIDLAAPLATIGSGSGNLFLASQITGSGSLILSSSTPAAMTVLSGAANQFVGGITLNSGSLVFNAINAFGSGDVTINSIGQGTLAAGVVSSGSLISTSTAIPNTFNISAGATLNLAGITTVSGAIVGSGGLYIAGSSGSLDQVTLTGPANFSGPTVVAGQLILDGPEGALTSTSSVTLGPGALLKLDNTDGANPSRLPPNAPINFNHATMSILGMVSQSLGSVNVAGQSKFTLAPQASLNLDSLNRINRGTILFDAQTGFSGFSITSINGLPPQSSLIGGGGGQGTTRVSILPFFDVDENSVGGGNGSGFATYAPATGLRLLNLISEYTPQLPLANYSGSQFDNVRVTQPNPAVPFGAVRNSLVIDGVNRGIWGLAGPNGSLTVTSGALLASGTGPARVAVGTLDFGPAEGILYAASASPLIISGAITGSNGITINGNLNAAILNETRLLNPASSFSGPITIDSGALSYQDDGALGNPANAIVLNGGFLQFRGYSGALTRPITVGLGGGGIVGINQGQVLTISSPVSGAGAMSIGGPLAGFATSATIAITGDNSAFMGQFQVEGGVLQIDSDQRLGAGSTVVLDSGALSITSSLSANRDIVVGLGTIHTTPGTTFTFNGRLLGGGATLGALFKAGSGTWALTNPQATSAPLTVSDGNLILQDNGTLSASAGPSVSGGGRLVLANSGTNISNRLGAGAVTLAGGTLRLEGSLSAPTTESISKLTIMAPSNSAAGALAASRLELVPVNAQPVTFTAGSLRMVNPLLTISGTGLSSTGLSRVQFTAPPALTNGILPQVFGIDAGNAGMVTTDLIPSGAAVRLLNAGEYTDSLTGAPTTANIRLAAPETVSASQTVNSLTLNGSGLTVNSGVSLTLGANMLLALPGNAGVSGSGTVFGSTALTIYTAGTAADTTVFDARFGGLIMKAGPGTLVANRPISVANGLNVLEGTLRLGSTGGINNVGTAPLNVQAGATFEMNDVSAGFGALVGSGTVQLGSLPSTVLTLSGGSASIGAGTNTFNGAIIGAGSIVKSGNQTITIANPAAVLAPIAVQGGRLAFAPSQFASTSMAGGPVSISDSAMLWINSGGILSRDVLVNVGATTGTSMLTLASGGLTASGNITIGASKTLNLVASYAVDGQSQITGAIGGTGRLTLSSGSSTLGAINLAGNNSYSGGTTISALNTVGIGSDTAFGAGTVTISAAATLATVNGPRSLSNNLAVNSDFTFDNFHSLSFTGSTTLGGAGSGRTVTALGAGNSTLSNVAGSGTVQSLTKAGGGTLTLAGNNTYTGPTAVTSGALLVAGGASLSGGGAVTVGGAAGSAPGILGGGGTIAGPVTVNASGIISLSTAPTTLTLQNGLTHSFGSTYLWNLNQNTTANPGVNWDRVAVTGGAVTITAGAKFVPSFIGSATVPNSAMPFWQTQQTWDNVILAGSVASTPFTIDNSVWASAGAFSTFASGAGVSLRWTPVPEPAGLLAVCGAALLVRKRARRLKPTATEL